MVLAMVPEVPGVPPSRDTLADVWVVEVIRVSLPPNPAVSLVCGTLAAGEVDTAHQATGPQTGHGEYLPGPEIRNSLVPVGIFGS